MAGCNEYRNPLQRSGTSQKQRQLPGLKPGYVDIDERRYSDWIVFATEFARYLKYYDTASGALGGDWYPFFSSDVSAVLGSIAVQHIEVYRQAVKERMDFIRSDDHENDEEGLKKNLSELFAAVYTLSKALDDYYKSLTDETAYRLTLQNLIKIKLAPALWRLTGYYEAVKPGTALAYYVPLENNSWRILNRQIADADVVLGSGDGLSDIWWQQGITSWAQQLAAISPDDSIFGPSGTVFEQISHAANHFLFSSVFDTFAGTCAKLVDEAEKSLAETLEQWDTHKPHYALFLTFLKLFRNSQKHINSLTWRHLDFYYKESLRLKPKAAVPNQVHLVAQLAKTVQQAALKAGTLFKAGKDSAGKEVLYALDRETTFSKAEVALFKAVYKGDSSGADNWNVTEDGQTFEINNENRLFAASVMNSSDGEGAELKTEMKEWHPMVNKTLDEEGIITAINMPPADIGFAVSSHYLFLAEGLRKIKVRIDNTSSSIQNAGFTCFITTEKAWTEIQITSVSTGTFSQGSASACTEFLITVDASLPAITAYNAKTHGGTYNVDVPVLKFVLLNESGSSAYNYESLKNITINTVEVAVEVGNYPVSGTPAWNADGIKQLFVSNAGGDLDISKPFQPWGAIPDKDMPLVIGNKELFSKDNTSFNLHIEWANRPTSSMASPPSATLQFLQGGKWTEASSYSLSGSNVCSSAQQKTFSSEVPLSAGAQVHYHDTFTSLKPSSQAGFMRILLSGNFGHATYNEAMTLYLIAQAKNPVPTAAPDKHDKPTTVPYTPTVKSVYISYKSASGAVLLSNDNEEIFSERPVQFFQVGAFGEAEQQAVLTGETSHTLLQQFTSKDKDGNTLHNRAEWYIGFKNLEPKQAVNVLFQVLEGSTDPRVSKPLDHVRWSYLANNAWVNFDNQHVSDGTRQLIQSGIITFTIPETATVNNTLFPAGYLWIKAAITEAADTVCKILSVQAQAMTLTYKPQGNAADFLDTPIAAGTISKLKEPNSAFKSFTQPYSAFGGRQAENSDHFYLRTSERLRHKGRAVTIWDYEHLVLEAYPQLHKVKCLNHTRVEDNTDESLSIYNENQPGYVAVITIPNLKNRNEVNPLKPYTNQNLLTEIREFLEARTSGQVKVNVCNPLFEEVFLDFKLQLAAGYEDFTYYSDLLKEEITKYLSPWAYDGQVEVQFGGKISKSSLINFIEERPYVDFITEVKMFDAFTRDSSGNPVDVDDAVASTSRSVLVSAIAKKHEINPYVPDGEALVYECDYLKEQAEQNNNT